MTDGSGFSTASKLALANKDLEMKAKDKPINLRGVETGSMYLQYVQGISPNVPAHTTFIEIYNKE